MLMFKIAKVNYCIFISAFICTAIFEDNLATKQPVITSLSYFFRCPLFLVEFTLDVAEFRGQFFILSL